MPLKEAKKRAAKITIAKRKREGRPPPKFHRGKSKKSCR
jgi:hypothetical protein